MTSGVVRDLDALNRICIPKSICRNLGWGPLTSLEITVRGGVVCLNQYTEGCVICGSAERIKLISDKKVCWKCRNYASNTLER